ncbi:MAG: hypothetical protein HC788_07580, partial [Sphingopyxis sp.]|nr:hypothetical protein [Sphingopyxis sp.]
MLDRSADTQLRDAVMSVSSKIVAALPAPLRPSLERPSLHAWGGVTPSPEGVDLAVLRQAIREETKLAFAYTDDETNHFADVLPPGIDRSRIAAQFPVRAAGDRWADL